MKNWIIKAQELAEIRSAIKRLELDKKALEEQLKQLQGNQSYAEGRFAFELSSCKGPIDYNAIPELKGVDLESYRKEETERWLFKVLW